MLEMHHFNDLDGILKQLSASPADKSWGEGSPLLTLLPPCHRLEWGLGRRH